MSHLYELRDIAELSRTEILALPRGRHILEEVGSILLDLGYSLE